MNTNSNADAGKNILWPGATPYFGASIAPKSLRASGVAPGHSVFAPAGEPPSHPASAFLPIPVRARPTLLTCATQVQPRRSHAFTKTT